MRSGLFVGELAKQGGVDPWTIRYYEKERLIPAAPRSASRYRLYPPETVDVIRFIKTAQGLGLTLEEIKKVIEAKRLKGKPCEHVVELLETKASDLHQRIKGMGKLKKTIGGLLKNWKRVRKSKTTCICEIIESSNLGGDTSLPPKPPSVEPRPNRSLRLAGRSKSDPANTRSLPRRRYSHRTKNERR